MLFRRSRTSRTITNISMMVVLAVGLAACGTGSGNNSSAGNAVESEDVIKITLHDWTGQLLTSNIAAAVLEEAGYNIELVKADYLAQFAGLETGDLHVAMEIWETTGREAMDASLATGKTVNLGETGMLAREEWWYPEYMKEQCPGLPDWKALNKCASKFATAETAPKGRYLGGPVTWGGFDEERVAALGMNFAVVHAGTDAALFAELESAYARKAPILLWIYQPHWAPVKFKGEFVEFPPYTPECYSNPAAPTTAQIKEAGLIPAVRNVSFEIQAGECFVVMGLSGCGKSTLVRCLSRITELTSGSILFDGQDLGSMSRNQLINIRRHKMGMVFQHFALLPHLSVLENVAFPLKIQGRSREEQLSRSHELIEIVGLKGREHYFPRQLSGGQQQRVGIARSLTVSPEVWFLDEPFSALDPLIRNEMQDEFLRLRELFKTTIVFITHDLDEAVRLADRIAIMRDGEIIQVDTPEQLILNPVDAYVGEFTKRISRSKVLTVGSVMSSQAVSSDSTVKASEKIADVAIQVIQSSGPIRVIDANGVAVGSIDKEAVIKVLAHTRA